MSDHVSGSHHGGFYTYASPDLPGVAPAIFSEEFLENTEELYGAVLPHDEFVKMEAPEGHGEHSVSFGQKLMEHVNNAWTYVWNGAHSSHTEEHGGGHGE